MGSGCLEFATPKPDPTGLRRGGFSFGLRGLHLNPSLSPKPSLSYDIKTLHGLAEYVFFFILFSGVCLAKFSEEMAKFPEQNAQFREPKCPIQQRPEPR